jgi:aldose 1-epimerase
VRIAWPQHRIGLTFTADPVFSRLVVYVHPGQQFFAVEPVTHDTDALNRGDDSGIVTLAPGASLEGSMRFAVASEAS